MDFEDKLANSAKSSKNEQPITKRSIIRRFIDLDWKAKIKLAVPLSIYFLMVAAVLKIIYELLFSEDSIFTKNMQESASEEELVCF